MKRLWLSLTGGLVLAALSFGTAHAAGETITDFNSQAVLGRDNILHVVEHISVDFAGNEHHGIYRTIPINLTDAGGHHYYYVFHLVSASDQTLVTNSGGQVKIRLGDPKSTLSGLRDYTITYDMSPVATNGSSDRFIWNITGQDWEYPIRQAEASYTLPAAPVDTPVCYTGFTFSTSSDWCSVSVIGTTLSVSSSETLNPGMGMTVDTHLPGGSFNTYLIADKRPPLSAASKIELAALAAALIVFLAELIWLLAVVLSECAKRKAQTVVAQYEPPDKLTPGQIGFLLDRRFGQTEMSATILDLAVRGYLKLTQIRAKNLFQAADYQFDRLKGPDGLTDYETQVYQLIFPGIDTPGPRSITLTSLKAEYRTNTSAPTLIKTFQKDIVNNLKAAGYLGSHSAVRGGKNWFASIFMILWGGAFILGATLAAAPAFSMIIAFIVIITSGVLIWRRPRLTDQGASEWARVEGFKLYLSVAEKDRLNFSDAPAKTPERFNALLPYAVALGVEKQWAKQFEGVDLSQSTYWYGGNPAAFAAGDFAGSFASGFSSAMSSSFAGSTGGGGVGGGGGGGGGGGW